MDAAEARPSRDRTANEQPFEGHFVVGGSGLYITTDCVGRTFTSRTANYSLEIGLPRRDARPDPIPPELRRRLGEPAIPNMELIPPGWAYPPTNERDRIEEEHISPVWGAVLDDGRAEKVYPESARDTAVVTTRARVAIAQGELEQAEHDAHDALARAAEIQGLIWIPDILECLGKLAGDADSHREAARLFGAADAIRERMGAVRFKVWDAGYQASVAGLRDAMGEKDFNSAWAEGAAMSTEEAIAYAQRGRGERKRPASGWASLTPTERDVVRLVSEGLTNNDIATRLFVPPRTVQAHLTHVYTKLGLTSRVQLAQEAARHP